MCLHVVIKVKTNIKSIIERTDSMFGKPDMSRYKADHADLDPNELPGVKKKILSSSLCGRRNMETMITDELISEIADSLLRPGKTFMRAAFNMSRAEAAAIFARLISEQKGEKISGKSNFNDVSKNEWYSDYIGYLSKYGIIKGYADNTFRPNDNVSRAEFVAMTVRFNSLFNDVKKGSYTVK